MFIVLLVVPALLVVIVTALSVLTPGLGRPVETPVGATAAGLVGHLRPPSQAPPDYSRPGGVETVRTTLSNPSSTAVVFVPVTLAFAAGAWTLDYPP